MEEEIMKEITDQEIDQEIMEKEEIEKEEIDQNTRSVASSLEALFGDMEEETFDLLSCPPPISKIKIERQALEKMFYMAQEMKNALGKTLEVYAFSIGNEENVITDILIPPQEVTYVHITISTENMIEVSNALKELNMNKKILGWNHSHCDFGVFFSGTDDANQENIFKETTNYAILPYIEKGIQVKFVYGMTVNVKREVYGEITTQMPCGAVLNRKSVEIEIIGDLPEDWDEETMRKIIRNELKLRVKMKKSAPPKIYPSYPLVSPFYIGKEKEVQEYIDETISESENTEFVDIEDRNEDDTEESVEDYNEESEEDFEEYESMIEDSKAMEKIDTFLKLKSEFYDVDKLERMKELLIEFGDFILKRKDFFP